MATSVQNRNAERLRAQAQTVVEGGKHKRCRFAGRIKCALSGRKVHAVVTSQPEAFSVFAGTTYQGFIDSDDV